MEKGQVEFIVIAGVILIVLFVVIYSIQQAGVKIEMPGIPGVGEEQKLIRDSIINLVRTGTIETLNTIYENGGYLDTSEALTIKYTDLNIPVWQGCGEINIPDVLRNIETGVANYIKANIKPEMEFYGKNVTFDLNKLRVNANLYKDKINIKVNLPTKVEGFSIQQLYETDIKTNLYEILDFSKNFVSDVNGSRFFEYITMTTMFYSNPESEYWLPLSGLLTECGKPLFKTRADLLPAANEIIKYTISHVVWGGTRLRIEDNPFYPINVVGGKAYPDLKVAFIYPQDWNLDENFAFSPDPVNIIPYQIFNFIPYCMTPYYISYSFQYPVIVMVEDKYMNRFFTFSVFVNIENNQPGECKLQLGPMSSEYQQLLRSSIYPVKITVKDSKANAVEGATVMFGSLYLGRTDSNGVVEAKVPHMLSELRVYKEGYKMSRELLTYEELNRTVVLKKIQDNITLNFYGVPIQVGERVGEGVYATYTPGNPIQISNSYPLQVMLSFEPKDRFEITIILNNINETDFMSKVVYEGLYPSDFIVSGTVTNNNTQLVTGYFNTTFTLEEFDNELYIYVPVVEGVTENINATESSKLTQAVINKCGGIVLRRPC